MDWCRRHITGGEEKYEISLHRAIELHCATLSKTWALLLICPCHTVVANHGASAVPNNNNNNRQANKYPGGKLINTRGFCVRSNGAHDALSQSNPEPGS